MNEQQDAILEVLEEGVIVVDEQMRIVSVNFIASKMLGHPKRQLIGQLFSSFSSELFDKCKTLLQTCFSIGEPLTDSMALGQGKSCPLYLDLIVSPVVSADGKMSEGATGAVLVLQDKSNHHKVLEMGKDFVANASHELRTPITIIKGFAETLQDMPELSAEMIADITEKIVRNCERMDSLVKNLLTLADIENLPKARFQGCDLGLLMENARQVLLCKYEKAHIAIEKEEGNILVGADPDLLELALINLLDNAAKYSQAPAHIAVHIGCLAGRLGDEVKVTISDKGMGIPEGDLPHVFERFYTVNKSHSRRLGGAGLGLSIVKTIIEKHEGVISVASTLGQGTTFTILFPRHRL